MDFKVEEMTQAGPAPHVNVVVRTPCILSMTGEVRRTMIKRLQALPFERVTDWMCFHLDGTDAEIAAEKARELRENEDRILVQAQEILLRRASEPGQRGFS